MEAILQQFGEQNVAGFILVLARISPLFLLAPLFSSKMVPARARGVVAVALTVGIAPIALHAGGRIPIDALGYSALLLKELLVGLAFSFSLGAVAIAWPRTSTGDRPTASATATIPRTRAGMIRLENSGASTNSGPTRASTRMNATSWCSPNC